MNTLIQIYIWGVWIVLVVAVLFLIPSYIRKRITESKKMVQGSEPYEPFQDQNLEDDLATIEKSDSGRLL